MANYKKYAEELIGNWETGQYEPQRETVQNVYQTNWNKLANDYNVLKDKLARNFSNAQTAYANKLSNVQGESFNRMRNANIDLANRGLSNSGMVDLVTQADTQRKGEDVDKALASLLATNNASIEGLTKGVSALGQQQSKLASDLAGDLGGLTKAEAASGQQYANLLASIGQGKAGRAASSASNKKSKEDERLEEAYRKLGIAETINNSELSDDEKRFILANSYDVNVNDADAAITAYNNNNLLDTTNAKINKLQDKINKTSIYPDDFIGRATRTADAIDKLIYGMRSNKLKNDISGLTYQDLDEILYGKR